MLNSELQLRLLTAAVLLVATLALLFLAPPVIFAGITLIILAIAAVEWFRLSELAPCQIWPWVTATLGVAVLLYYAAVPLLLPAMAAIVLWLGLMALLWRDRSQPPALRPAWIKRLLGVAILALFWFALVQIHAAADGAWLLLGGLLMVAAADSTAYFAGRRFGRHKLAVGISPGKTLVGVFGGVLGAVISAVLIGLLLPGFESASVAGLMLLAVLLAVFSVAGDLEESRLKREMDVKDSGRILPGHGGILDRVDGQLAAMPVWLFGLWLMQLV